jgi:chromosome segregation ATPase
MPSSPTLAVVDHALNPRTHLRRSAEDLQRELARLATDPTADERRVAALRNELRLVEAELAALERHQRQWSSGR